MICCFGLKVRGLATPNVMVGVLIFFGGACQFISGIMEFVSGNTVWKILISSSSALDADPASHPSSVPPCFHLLVR